MSIEQRFSEIVRSTAERARSLAAILIISATLGGCQSELYSGLSEKEAAETVVVLNANQIAVTRKASASGENTILVDDAEQARAIQVLAAVGLPKQRFANLGQVFDGRGIVSTPTEERARLMYALSEEVSQSIGRIEGIQSARAHISIPEKDRIGGQVVPPRASVYVYYRAGQDISNVIPSIKALVANSVEGMNYEDVAVETFPTRDAALANSDEKKFNFGYLSFTTILIFLTSLLVLGMLARQLLGDYKQKSI